MNLVDLFGFMKRNVNRWNDYQLNKTVNELNQIIKFLERKQEQRKGVA